MYKSMKIIEKNVLWLEIAKTMKIGDGTYTKVVLVRLIVLDSRDVHKK